jgi:hypothetical protein
MLKPQLYFALERFFLNGGLVEELDAQQALFDDLENAGVRIDGEGVAEFVEGLKTAGKWRNRFVGFVIFGIDKGVNFSIRSKNDLNAIEDAFRKAKFTPDDISRMKNGSRLFY